MYEEEEEEHGEEVEEEGEAKDNNQEGKEWPVMYLGRAGHEGRDEGMDDSERKRVRTDHHPDPPSQVVSVVRVVMWRLVCVVGVVCVVVMVLKVLELYLPQDW